MKILMILNGWERLLLLAVILAALWFLRGRGSASED